MKEEIFVVLSCVHLQKRGNCFMGSCLCIFKILMHKFVKCFCHFVCLFVWEIQSFWLIKKNTSRYYFNKINIIKSRGKVRFSKGFRKCPSKCVFLWGYINNYSYLKWSHSKHHTRQCLMIYAYIYIFCHQLQSVLGNKNNPSLITVVTRTTVWYS